MVITQPNGETLMELQCPKPGHAKKVNINATLSPHLVKRMDRLVFDEEFSSVSDLISIAVTEFLMKFPNCEEVKV